jgi:hypothetical protein
MSDRKALPQWVVVYDGDGETARIFETAYTESQIQSATLRCQNHHGSRSNPRAILGQKRFEGEKR